MSDPINKSLKVLSDAESDSLLRHFDRARQELAIASDIDEIKQIRDQAESLRQYARQQKVSLEMQNRFAEVKVRAERRAGEILSTLEKNPGGQAEHKSYWSSDVTGTIPKLSDMGISKNQSSKWQLIANIPERDFEDQLEKIKKKGLEITSQEFIDFAGYLNRLHQRNERTKSAFEESRNVEPDGKIQIRHGDFRLVLADIPDNSVQLILTDPVYSKEHLQD